MENLEILRRVDLFRGLQEKELESIAQVCEVKSYKVGEKIFAEGSPGDELYIVKRGMVSIEAAVRGEVVRAALAILNEGQIFGELALIDRGQRSATAKSLVDCEVIHLSRDKLFRLFEENIRIGYITMRNIATVLCARMRMTDQRLTQAML